MSGTDQRDLIKLMRSSVLAIADMNATTLSLAGRTDLTRATRQSGLPHAHIRKSRQGGSACAKRVFGGSARQTDVVRGFSRLGSLDRGLLCVTCSM